MLLVRVRWFWGVRVGGLRGPRWLHDVDLIPELTGQSVPYCKSTTQKNVVYSQTMAQTNTDTQRVCHFRDYWFQGAAFNQICAPNFVTA